MRGERWCVGGFHHEDESQKEYDPPQDPRGQAASLCVGGSQAT